MKKVALITGGAKRIGKAIVRAFHNNSFNVIIHYHHSQTDAQNLADELNAICDNSAKIIKADLAIVNDKNTLADFKNQVMALFGRIDILVHNASSFYPSDINDEVDKWQNDWDDLFLTNAKAPLFLSHVFKDELVKTTEQSSACLTFTPRINPLSVIPSITWQNQLIMAWCCHWR